jgi:flavin-dependent dehydrogenase
VAEKVEIIGAGPAGASAAYFLALKGYDVVVYDNSPYPGFKPCGWAVPKALENIVKLGDAILNEIRGFRVYVDSELAHEYHGSIMGYIVDKPKLLAALLEQSTVVCRTVKTPWRSRGGPECSSPNCIVATGSITPPPRADFINAVELDVDNSGFIEDDVIELWFEGSLVGYYWVFPRGRKVNIGVGGYANFDKLLSMLKGFLERRLGRGYGKLASKARGARINVSGAADVTTSPPYVVGEAAGFVYPLTGEGIRPSIESGRAIALYISSGIDPRRELENTVRWIRRQRKLLDKVIIASPRTRSTLMRIIPTELLPLIGMGQASKAQLLKLAAKAPLRIASLIKTLLSD